MAIDGVPLAELIDSEATATLRSTELDYLWSCGNSVARSLKIKEPTAKGPTTWSGLCARAIEVVHPDDARVARDVLADDHHWQNAVEVVGDLRVEPGGCVLEGGECHIDAQIGPALDRVRAALLGD